MAVQKIGLFSVGTKREGKCDCDIVFVHGLNGCPDSSWTSENGMYWPQLLFQQLHNVNVWSYGYEVKATHWSGHTMPIYDRAINTLEWLCSTLSLKNKIVFICHSFGGLLIKAVLRQAEGSLNNLHQSLVQKTASIVFISTPHTGSQLANYFEHLSFLTRKTVTVSELKSHNPYLRELNDWYRNNSQLLNIDNLVFFETKRTNHVLVVDSVSANPGITGITPIPLDDDHSSICKPISKESLINTRVVRFVSESIKKK
jgi:protein SERAC1